MLTDILQSINLVMNVDAAIYRFPAGFGEWRVMTSKFMYQSANSVNMDHFGMCNFFKMKKEIKHVQIVFYYQNCMDFALTLSLFQNICKSLSYDVDNKAKCFWELCEAFLLVYVLIYNSHNFGC